MSHLEAISFSAPQPLIPRSDLALLAADWIRREWGELPLVHWLSTNEGLADGLPLVLHILDQHGELVAIGALLHEDMTDRPAWDPWLGCLVVRDDVRRRGLARKLVVALQRAACRLAIPRLYLFCEPPLDSFYYQEGWAVVEERDYEQRRAIVMQKPLPRLRFHWTSFDVRSLLPSGWQEEISECAEHYARERYLVTRHTTSRESSPNTRLRTATVPGRTVQARIPWLKSLYVRQFRDLVQSLVIDEPVTTMRDDRFAITLNVQQHHDRYECHVDTNPLEGLLYVTSHPEGTGGELVVANDLAAKTVDAVEADATVIEPKAGYFVVFDGRAHSHYVRRLVDPSAIRIVAAMNYYVPTWPEELRPKDLNEHLAGHE